jgi:phosphomannomutase
MAKPVMIGVSGIRGIVGEGLSPQLITDFSAAVGTFYGAGRVIVGRDSRKTGEMVKSAVFAGLLSVGCSPVDLGVCPTPTVQLRVQNSDAVGGIVITASHNPVEWNALKLLTNEGLFLDSDEGARVQQIVNKKQFHFVSWDDVGPTEIYEHAIQDHINAVLGLSFLDVPNIQKRAFRVAFDCVNGAGGTILPDLFKALGCELFPLNQEPHGRFAHTPEPVPENITDLCRQVHTHHADIGFAVDPDVDRLAIVAETGDPLGEEYTIVLAAKYLLSQKKGKVVVNVSTTRAIDDVARESGAEVIRTSVGEIHVAKKMKEVHAVVGGEGNGGVLLPEAHLGRDAPVAIALTLQHLLESRMKLSELWGRLPQYRMTKKKIAIGSADPDAILHAVRKRYNGEKLVLIDGVKIERPDSWIHIRKSNTEPIIRIIAEAPSEKASELLCTTFVKQIQDIIS